MHAIYEKSFALSLCLDLSPVLFVPVLAVSEMLTKDITSMEVIKPYAYMYMCRLNETTTLQQQII